MAASETKSKVSSANHDKNEKKVFYILILATQTKQILLKRYIFHILLTSSTI